MPTDKTRAAAHYGAMAVEVLQAQLDAFTGRGAKPQPGCGHATMQWGSAECVVEYEFEPAEGDGWNEPRHEASITILGVLLNSVWCDAEEVVPPLMLAAWTERLFEMRAEMANETKEPA